MMTNMRVQIIRRSDGKSYVQVVEDHKKPDGTWTTKVIQSFGPATSEHVQEATEYLAALTRRDKEPDAPTPCFNSRPLETLVRLVERRLEGLTAPTSNPLPAFPRLQYGLYLVGYLTLKEQIEEYEKMKNKEILMRLIYQTQPDLTTEGEFERFYNWIKDKSPEEKFKVLSKRWSYKEA
jgi:hypothetical protein